MGIHKFTRGFVALLLTVSTVVVVAPQAVAALLPHQLTITVTKDASESVQSVAVLPLDINNAPGYSTLVKVSASASELAPSLGTLSSPKALVDDSFGFALQGNPTAQVTNLLPNGFGNNYSAKDSVAPLAELFAGIGTTPEPILQSEVEGQSTVNLYLSARVASSLAVGDYRVTLNVETVSTTTTTVSGTITWTDNDNQDGIRPTTVALELYKTVGGTRSLTTEVATLTTTTNPWTYNFDNLPIEEDGQPVIYDVEPALVPGYESTRAENDFTYTHVPGTTYLAGTITWDDNDNQDGLRPITTVTLELYKTVGGVRTLTTEVATCYPSTDPNVWDFEFANLPAYESGAAVTYDVKPSLVPDYAPSQTGSDLTYTHVPGTTSLDATITWADTDNADKVRPGTVALTLFQTIGGTRTQVAGAVASLYPSTADSNLWDYSFDNLPKYQAGSLIGYDVEAASVSGYTLSSPTGNDFTYSHVLGNNILKIEPNGGAPWFLDIRSIFRNQITSVVFTDTRPTSGIDVSAAGNDTIRADFDAGTGILTIGADGGVVANPVSAWLFRNLNLTTLDLTHFRTDFATDMMGMFSYTTLPATFTSFPDGFGSLTTNMNNMFGNAKLLGITKFSDDFGYMATNMNNMFGGTQLPVAFTSFPDSFGSLATDMGSMFSGTTLPAALTGFPDGFGSKAENMSRMFNGTQLPAAFTGFPDGFGSKAENMSDMFSTTYYGSTTMPAAFTSFPDGFGSQAKDMSSMFRNIIIPAITEFPDGFGSQGTNMSNMFNGTQLPALTKFPDGFGSLATNMESMICVTTLPATFTSFPDGFGSLAENMGSMLSNTQLADFTEFPDDFGSKATMMNSMFSGAQLPVLTEFPAGFGSVATNMNTMFYGSHLPSLTEFPADFGSKAENMGNMFSSVTLSSSLTEFPAGFGSKAEYMVSMFKDVIFTTNLDWSQTTFVNLATSLNVTDMFWGTQFDSFTITVIDSSTQAKFTDSATQISTPGSIIY